MNIRARLLVVIVSCGVLPMIGIGAVAWYGTSTGTSELAANAKDALRQRAEAGLTSVAAARSNDIQHYFENVAVHVQSLAADPHCGEAMAALGEAMTGLVPKQSDGTRDDGAVARLRGELGTYVQREFGGEFARRNGGQAADTAAILGAMDATTIAAQTAMIAKSRTRSARRTTTCRRPTSTATRQCICRCIRTTCRCSAASATTTCS